MDVRAFNREKMQWLNAISLECEVNSTAFRVAYLIADHQNSVAGFAWPSLARLAGKVCLSNKSIQRAVGQLERLGWLEVERRRERSNRYRLRWPPGRAPAPRPTEGNDADKTVLVERQERLTGGDKTVRQSYLTKSLKTFSSRLGGGRQGTRFADQGKFEAEIIGRFGPGMIDVLEKLNEIDPRAVEQLCRRAKNGTLSRVDIAAAELTVAQNQ
ncbi:helix-turn-helix domain-containing protein [Bradyrhizobium sp. CCGE-LA001]|uniref:helix-turn-helix domain-containing protein n=1 Tax=Bradyrhizobium sp. CCGE-LA001 TaxID=1223566 RepID=UPI0009FB13EC|nr:helix-turn-helix domain-containing protein [Bradyrhizobium sp. CCGE-LA001]